MATVNTTEAGASANVSSVVRMLLAGRGEKFDVLVPQLGIGRTTTFEKVAGKRRWYADEVQALADFFGVGVDVLYGGSSKLLPTSCDYWVSDGVASQPYLLDLLLADSGPAAA